MFSSWMIFPYQLPSDGVGCQGPTSKETLAKIYHHFYILTLNTVRRILQLNVSFRMFSLLLSVYHLQRECTQIWVCVYVFEYVCRRGKVHSWLLEIPVGLLIYLWSANPDGQREVKIPVLSARDTQSVLGPDMQVCCCCQLSGWSKFLPSSVRITLSPISPMAESKIGHWGCGRSY